MGSRVSPETAAARVLVEALRLDRESLDDARRRAYEALEVGAGGFLVFGGAADEVAGLVGELRQAARRPAFSSDAGNVSPLFTNPQGPAITGLGLSEADIDALVDFIENGLFDPAFAVYDPTSPTDTACSQIGWTATSTGGAATRPSRRGNV